MVYLKRGNWGLWREVWSISFGVKTCAWILGKSNYMFSINKGVNEHVFKFDIMPGKTTSN